jgi:hypothetical protein
MTMSLDALQSPNNGLVPFWPRWVPYCYGESLPLSFYVCAMVRELWLMI